MALILHGGSSRCRFRRVSGLHPASALSGPLSPAASVPCWRMREPRSCHLLMRFAIPLCGWMRNPACRVPWVMHASLSPAASVPCWRMRDPRSCHLLRRFAIPLCGWMRNLACRVPCVMLASPDLYVGCSRVSSRMFGVPGTGFVTTAQAAFLFMRFRPIIVRRDPSAVRPLVFTSRILESTVPRILVGLVTGGCLRSLQVSHPPAPSFCVLSPAAFP